MSSDLRMPAASLELTTRARQSVMQSISALPSTAVAIDGQHTDTVATADTARQVQAGLTSILELTVERIEQLCRERMLLVQLYKRQLAAWRRIALNAVEVAEIDRLDRVIHAETAIVAELLAIAKESCGGTVEGSTSKSPLELHLEAQLRTSSAFKSPGARPSYRHEHRRTNF